MLYCLAPVFDMCEPTTPVLAVVVIGPYKSFATADEARIEPGPTGTASATAYCFALTSPSDSQPPVKVLGLVAATATGWLPRHLYFIVSYARPISITPKFQP